MRHWYALGSNLEELWTLIRRLADIVAVSSTRGCGGLPRRHRGSLWLLALVAKIIGIPIGVGAGGLPPEEYAAAPGGYS